MLKRIYLPALLLYTLTGSHNVIAELTVTTSSDPESNQANSFIVIPYDKTIMQGIKLGATPEPVPQQIPFSVRYTQQHSDAANIQWEVYIPDKAIGRIKLVSSFNGSYNPIKPGRLWRSEKLDPTIENRNSLVFKPSPQTHQPSIYKKGRSSQNTRRKYGGGTTRSDDYIYNPRLTYNISAIVTQRNGEVETYTVTISQDDRDLLRQEYINHYGRERYGRGDKGNIPIPRRDELTEVPQQDFMAGASFSQSIYPLMVEDGAIQLARQVVSAFERKKQQLQQTQQGFIDLDGNPLPITQNPLWLSSGWRNPERNEWYSNAINGVHQRGAAVDIVPNEQPMTRISAATYWLLWQTLNDPQFNIPGYWQLETLGRPMKTSEYTLDIQPENGIPDAFDIADHLHIQLESVDE